MSGMEPVLLAALAAAAQQGVNQVIGPDQSMPQQAPQLSDPSAQQPDIGQQLQAQAAQPQVDPNQQMLQLLLMLVNQNRPQ